MKKTPVGLDRLRQTIFGATWGEKPATPTGVMNFIKNQHPKAWGKKKLGKLTSVIKKIKQATLSRLAQEGARRKLLYRRALAGKLFSTFKNQCDAAFVPEAEDIIAEENKSISKER